MSISITIGAMTAEQARQEMRALLGDPVAVVEAPAVEPTEPTKRGRGRPPKARDEVTDINADGDAVEQVTAEAEAATPVAEVTKEEIKAAVLALNKAKGENACHALFTKYGAKNVTTAFETGRGAEFIKEAEEMVATDDAVFASRFPNAVVSAA